VVLAGVAHGVLLGASLPPVGVWVMALVAVVPLVWAGCRSANRPMVGGLLAGLGTLPIWFYESYWLVNVTAPGYPGLAVYLALYPALFVWLVGVVRRVDWPVPMVLAAPVLWVMLEVLRGELVMTGYAWYLLGHPLIDAPALAAPASLLGVYGVSFLVAALAGAVADASGWSGVHRPVGGAGALVTLVLWAILSLAGRPGAESPAARDVRFGVVQTNLPQSNKVGWGWSDRIKDFQRFAELTRQAAAGPDGPLQSDVVVWPETMFPGMTLNPEAVETERSLGLSFGVKGEAALKFAPGGRLEATRFADEIVKLQREIGIPMLVGAIGVEGDYRRWLVERLGPEEVAPTPGLIRRFNSALVIGDGEVQRRRYDKRELTPFGEVIPYVWRFPRVQQWVLGLGAAGMSFDLVPGGLAAGLDVPVGGRNVRMATPICFEATKAELCRTLVRGDGSGRASVLVNLSNDGWFGDFDPGRAQHLLASRWRCVELGVPMVRAVNTGYSAAIDRRGVLTQTRLADQSAGPSRVDGVLLASVRIDPDRPTTMFERVGLGPAMAVSILGGIGSVTLLLRRRRIVRAGG